MSLSDSMAPTVRYATLNNGDIVLDEVIATNASVHIEAMNDDHWWMTIRSGGEMVTVNLYTNGAEITANAEIESAE